MITDIDRASRPARRRAAPVAGIVGGGHLARMTQHAASRLGITLVVLDPDPAAPAVRAGARELAVIVARSADGTHAAYPTIETVRASDCSSPAW